MREEDRTRVDKGVSAYVKMGKLTKEDKKQRRFAHEDKKTASKRRRTAAIQAAQKRKRTYSLAGRADAAMNKAIGGLERAGKMVYKGYHNP